ncbi:TlpA family protein disulfide reductase [Acuticoccus sp. M5D2P5]|uniref:TlpA family protein disulfide reductase n=1 Tax=Acuticoccus kalidii TaxID=2910977 RepID=UPI001F2A63B7|nr:TlpA disulfide reductase family protein [Acuticoccus kalidii]MCF3935500.1 TlpA family protein disulfide reductase [Acuticoccus kalidii]
MPLVLLFLVLALPSLPARAEPPAPLATLILEDRTTCAALSDLVGREATIVHLWATWCAPCLDELPALAAFLDAHPERADDIVIVSVDTMDRARIEGFLSERLDLGALPTWRVAHGNPGQVLKVKGYPSTIAVEANGEIAAIHAGPVDWSAADPTAPLLGLTD